MQQDDIYFVCHVTAMPKKDRIRGGGKKKKQMIMVMILTAGRGTSQGKCLTISQENGSV